jgi:hypothetical protein
VLISLPQSQHPVHYRHALYYPEHRLVDLAKEQAWEIQDWSI